jgi:hypothetical protein
MKDEHKKLLQEKLDAAFKALNELSDIITEEDMIWADKVSSDEVGTDDEVDLAIELVNIEDNLREMSHAFGLRM